MVNVLIRQFIFRIKLQAGVIEEFVDDALDNALDSEDIEEEIEEEVDKVLTSIAGETAAQLPEAVRKEKMKQPAQTTPQEACLIQMFFNVLLPNLDQVLT